MNAQISDIRKKVEALISTANIPLAAARVRVAAIVQVLEIIDGSESDAWDDTKRLDWLLRNMNQKGFDDLACGICSRADIDAAAGIPDGGITLRDISETIPPKL